MNAVDRDGKAAVAAVAWAIPEITGNVYDVYDTASTVLDPTASHRDKVLSIGGLAAGVVLPGAGYGKGAKVVATKVDDAIAEQRVLARRAATLGAEMQPNRREDVSF
ncbi:MAG: hypothetical protein U5J83_17735 [Bryobacterales bacterium]|nr:hypothetical protein [Bryobacterales bacterium]